MFIHVLIKYYQGTTDQWKVNNSWIEKELPNKREDIKENIDWCNRHFNKIPLQINHGMLPFLVPMGGSEDGTLRLQYGPVNHNQISQQVALEIANNLAGNPMQYISNHDSVMDKGLELVFYKSNEVRINICYY